MNRSPQPSSDATVPQPPQRGASLVRPLGAMDCGMLSTDRVLRAIGHPDFETQTLLWLSGRLDRERVATGLRRFVRRYPLVAARLDHSSAAAPAWRIPAEPQLPLHETALDTAAEEAVHAFAARLLATPHDPAAEDPLRFHLVHLPDGRDVFLAQYTHLLMDNTGIIGLLGDLDRLAGNVEEDASPLLDGRDLAAEYLGRHSWRERLSAAARVLNLRFRGLRHGAVTLSGAPVPTGPARHNAPVRFEMARRSLNSDDLRRITARSARICGLPSVSMALLAAAFRALGRHTRELPSRRKFIAGIGVDLGLRERDRPAFQNLMSIIPAWASWHELDDYDSLLRMLAGQFRERLRQAADLGLVELARFVSRRPRLADRSVRRVMLGGYSLWYAYFGSLDAIGETFCGADIDNVCFTAPTWAPMGLTLLATQFRGRLRFQATSLPDLVPPGMLEAFLESMLTDLRG